MMVHAHADVLEIIIVTVQLVTLSDFKTTLLGFGLFHVTTSQ